MNTNARFDLRDAAGLLSRTPGLLDHWLRDLPHDWLHATEGEGTFSPFSVVGHLISGERSDWIQRARHILEGRPGEFAPFDRFGHEEEFRGRPVEELLELFARLRRANLTQLEALGLQPPDLERTGLHPAFGEVRLGQLLSTWVVHDQGHLAQIARVLAKRYADAVGPWRAYLPVLGDRT